MVAPAASPAVAAAAPVATASPGVAASSALAAPAELKTVSAANTHTANAAAAPAPSTAPTPPFSRRHRSALHLIQSAAAASAERHAAEQEAKRKAKVVASSPLAEQERDGGGTRTYLHKMATKSRMQQAPPPRDGSSHWDAIGAGELKDALRDTVLVDAAWLAALAESGDILPRCQDVPEAAKVRLEEMEAWSAGSTVTDADTVGALIVSYPWLDPDHPDPRGEQLRAMAFVFRAFAGSAQTRRGCRVGVFLDYCSLPQRRCDGHDDRSAEEHARFRRALMGINAWYGHRCTHVLLVNTPLPSGPGSSSRSGGAATQGGPYTNTMPYAGRGWCVAESLMSAIVKDRSARIELSRLTGDEWPAEQLAIKGGCAERQPPIAPDAFRSTLASGLGDGTIKFTHRGDLDLVCAIYARAFLAEMGKATELAYPGLAWGDEQLATLATALAYAHDHGSLARLASLDLHANRIGDAGCEALASVAAPRLPCLLACLPIPESRRPLARLETLHLHSNAIGDRGLHALVQAAERGAFPNLEELILSENAISDFGPLARALAAGSLPAIQRVLVVDNPGSGAQVRRALRAREQATAAAVASSSS